jgi:hypothetical protein
MALTDFQRKNPLRAISSGNRMSYIARSFDEVRINEMREWFGTSALKEAMDRGWELDEVWHGKVIVRGFIRAVANGHFDASEAGDLWGALWKAGAAQQNTEHSLWLEGLIALPLGQRLVDDGVSPHEMNWQGLERKSPWHRLLRDIVQPTRSTTRDRNLTHEQLVERLELWWDVGSWSQEALDDALDTVTWRGYGKGGPVPENKMFSWAQRLIEQGADPFRHALARVLESSGYPEPGRRRRAIENEDKEKARARHGHTVRWARALSTNPTAKKLTQCELTMDHWQCVLWHNDPPLMANLAMAGHHPWILEDVEVNYGDRQIKKTLLSGTEPLSKDKRIAALLKARQCGSVPDERWRLVALSDRLEKEQDEPMSSHSWRDLGKLMDWRENGITESETKILRRWAADRLGMETNEARTALESWTKLGILDSAVPEVAWDWKTPPGHSLDGWVSWLTRESLVEALEALPGIGGERLREMGAWALATNYRGKLPEEHRARLLGWSDGVIDKMAQGVLPMAIKQRDWPLCLKLLDQPLPKDMHDWLWEQICVAASVPAMRGDQQELPQIMAKMVGAGVDPNQGAVSNRPLSRLLANGCHPQVLESLIRAGARADKVEPLPKDSDHREWVDTWRLELALSQERELAQDTGMTKTRARQSARL